MKEMSAMPKLLTAAGAVIAAAAMTWAATAVPSSAHVAAAVTGRASSLRPPTAYVTITRSGTVRPVNTATNRPGARIPVQRDPIAIAITPNGKTAYVVSHRFGSVTTINTATNKHGKVIHIGQHPRFIAITPDGRTAYVANDSGVTPISTGTNRAGP